MSERQRQLPQTQDPSHPPQQQATGGTKQPGCDDPKKPESIDTPKDQKLDPCDDPTPPSPKPEPCQDSKLDRLALQPLGDDLHSLTEPAGQLQLPITIIELPPRLDYSFALGITGLRGTLIEERAIPPDRPVPVADGEVCLRWLDDDGITWHNAPTASTRIPTAISR